MEDNKTSRQRANKSIGTPYTAQGIWTEHKQSHGPRGKVIRIFFHGSNNWKFIPELLTPSKI